MLVTSIVVAGPGAFVTGLVVGVGVSVFQALTSVQEQTLVFAQDARGHGVTLLLLVPCLGCLRDYTLRVLGSWHSFGLS
jgi:flagellar biosynthetic protein FliQ